MNKKPPLLMLGAVLLAATNLKAENWPQFRGPTGQGHSDETGVPLNWSATDNIAWKTPLPGEGWSSPIGDGLVFAAGEWGGKESIKAFKLGGAGDLKESNLVWEQKKGMPKVPSMLFVKPYLFALGRK